MIKLLSFLAFSSLARADNSIGDLPELGQRIVHHYNCTAMLVVGPNSDNQEKSFTVDGQAGGQQGTSVTVSLGQDQLVASASNQMLSLDWTRSGKKIASSSTMIQVSDTKAYVLIVEDPANDSNQANISCSAVTFADQKGAR